MNRVLLSLTATLFLAVSLLPFVHFSLNRFIGGEDKSLFSLSPSGYALLHGLGLFLLLLAIFWQRLGDTHASLISLGITLGLFGVIFALLSSTSDNLMTTGTPIARVTIGSAFWLGFLSLSLMLLDSWQRLSRHHVFFFFAFFLAVIGLVLAFTQQTFDSLSLIKEYRNHQGRFIGALADHLYLVFAAFVPTFILGTLLGSLAWRYPQINRPFFAWLNFLQTIPSLALFALLMLPLSWLASHYPSLQALGISGIGTTPSVIALVLYTLLPLARNTYAGLSSIPADIREAAWAMGMSKRQVFYQVILPLALPMILSGTRIVLVQLIGLAVVAALIGAGGLGIFVWEGLGQYALDLVLLGALPTIILALLADLFLQGLIKLTYSSNSTNTLSQFT